MRGISWSVLALGGLAAAVGPGCAEGESCADDLGACVGCPGAGTRLLSAIGDTERVVFCGDRVELEVVLVERCVGVLLHERVDFELLDDPGDSSLEAGSAATDDDGVARTVLQAGQLGGQVRVRAHRADVPEDVTFSIEVRPVVRGLQIMGNSTVTLYPGERVELTVRAMDLGRNVPLSGHAVRFELSPTCDDASLAGELTITNLSGLASTSFRAGSQAGTCQVDASSDLEPLDAVSFTFQVIPPCVADADCQPGYHCLLGVCAWPGSVCDTDDECHEGYVCRDYLCLPRDTLPTSCWTSTDCPGGYFCEGEACLACDETSPLPECQDVACVCDADPECTPGFHCQNCICIPQNPAGAVIPDLAGRWRTRHHLDLRSALPGFAQTMLEGIDLLDRIVEQCALTGHGFVDRILCGLADELLPDWLPALAGALADLGGMLGELRIEGELKLVHLNPPELLSGREWWNRIYLRYPGACCLGQPQGCIPAEQPDFPGCATLEILREDLEYADVGLELLPFTGKVDVDEDGSTTLAVDPRQVRVQLDLLVAFLVDLLVQTFLGYEDLEEALEELLDCQAIQELVEDLWPIGGSAPDISQACESHRPTAAELLGGLLGRIGPGFKVLDLRGWATLTVDDGFDPPRGIRLGYPDFETRESADGSWTGTFQGLVGGEVQGGWYAER